MLFSFHHISIEKLTRINFEFKLCHIIVLQYDYMVKEKNMDSILEDTN